MSGSLEMTFGGNRWAKVTHHFFQVTTSLARSTRLLLVYNLVANGKLLLHSPLGYPGATAVYRRWGLVQGRVEVTLSDLEAVRVELY